MEKRIELERRARKANQITDLNLDNCRSTSIVGLTDEYTALESLSLINVGLTTLKGFPKLPNLKKLELSDNRISNGLHYLTTSPKLQSLNLSGNKIKDLETLKPLEEFKGLFILDLFNNEVTTKIDNYREKIFEMLPSLKYLDGFDCHDVECTSESENDDDELNGNDSEDDDLARNAFSINGLEIDLDELEAFEQHLKAKKRQASNVETQPSSNDTTAASTRAPNDDELVVDVRKKEGENGECNVGSSSVTELDDLDLHLQQLKLKEAETAATTSTTPSPPLSSAEMKNIRNFATLLFWFLSILQLANIACFSEVMGEDDDDTEYASDSDYNGDVSLAEVYNEDLEEDNSDWEEGDGVEDDEDDDDEDDEDADGEANESTASAAGKEGAAAPAAAAEDEPHARGKKRKHEG